MIDDDRDVVRAVRRGDRDAFGHLVHRYQQRLFGLSLMMMRERTAAEDVTQEAFVRAFTHLDRYDTQRAFYPWLATIAIRLAQNALRRRGRTDQREGAAMDAAPEPAAPAGALAGLVAAEQRHDLIEAVAALTSGERTAVFLYYADELPVRDVARALGVTTGTVKTLLFRARRRLRERLAGAPPQNQERSR